MTSTIPQRPSAFAGLTALLVKSVRLVARSGPASDMLHNLRFRAQHTGAATSVGTPDLAHKTATAFHAADVTLRAPTKPGTYDFCTVPGHAQGGMWGTLRVR